MIAIDQERLSGAIRMKRQAMPLSEAAVAIGISRATLHRLERGQFEPSARVLLSACRWLGRDPFDFVFEVPGLADLRGIAPDCTGDKSSEEFVRDLREEWDR